MPHISIRYRFYMSKYCLYVSLPRIVGRWVRHRYCSKDSPTGQVDPAGAVRFPARSPVNRVIVDALRVPGRQEHPRVAGPELTAIEIPWSDARPANRWHAVTRAGERAICAEVDALFVHALWHELLPLAGRAGLNDGVAAWCLRNGLEEEDVEAVRQRFYRLRKGAGLKVVKSAGIFCRV